MHYYQRPDATHVEVDPGATSLSGWGGRLSFAKQGGNVLFDAAVGALSPGFDPNDIGYQMMGSDKINYHIIPGYAWLKPGKVFQQIVVLGGIFGNYDFEGNKIWAISTSNRSAARSSCGGNICPARSCISSGPKTAPTTAIRASCGSAATWAIF
jgi:hypothetical protein